MSKGNPFAQKGEIKGKGKMPPKGGIAALRAAQDAEKGSKKSGKKGGNPFTKGKK